MASQASLNVFVETEMALAVLPTQEVLVAFTLFPPVQSGHRTDFALLRLRADRLILLSEESAREKLRQRGEDDAEDREHDQQLRQREAVLCDGEAT